MEKLKYKAVIFDFDDTLVETHLIKWEHHKTVAKKFYNINLTEENIKKHWGKPFPLLLPALYEYADTYENMLAAIMITRNDFLKKILPESIKTITTLLDHGLKVGILSATNRNFIIEDLIRLHFPIKRLIAIQSAEDTKVHKPNPKVFLPLLVKLKKEEIKKDEIVYIGDSLDDLEASKGAGIDFIAVTTGLYSSKDFKNRGAKVIIKNIKEVIKKII